MFNVKLYISVLLLIFSIFVSACIANSQQQPSQQVTSEIKNKTESKKELAKQVLSELGIAKQYDLYLNNSIDITIPASTNNDKLRKWLQAILAKEAGWQNIEEQYITVLEANFSQLELQQLLSLSKKPLMKKLLQSEIQAYSNTSKQRQKLLEKVINDYNSGKINPPQDILR